MIFWKPSLVHISIRVRWDREGRCSRGHPSFAERKSFGSVIVLLKVQEFVYVYCALLPPPPLFWPFGVSVSMSSFKAKMKIISEHLPYNSCWCRDCGLFPCHQPHALPYKPVQVTIYITWHCSIQRFLFSYVSNILSDFFFLIWYCCFGLKHNIQQKSCPRHLLYTCVFPSLCLSVSALSHRVRNPWEG